jgi:peptide methionine sulfoxide reductase msrA/msrB
MPQAAEGLSHPFYHSDCIYYMVGDVLINTQNDNPNLTFEERFVLDGKATEIPFTGKYHAFWGQGIYVCKRCRNALYRSESKFEADSGLPCFDQELPGSILLVPDADKVRLEIVCANCGAHLGYLFTGEMFTPKNMRHCVNSLALDFIPDIYPI